MESLSSAVDPQIVLLVAAIAVAVLLFRLVFQILNVGLGSILSIVAIVLLLQFVFGISPKALLYEVSHLPQDIIQWVKSFT